MIIQMISVLLSSSLLACALPAPVIKASPVLSSTDLLHSTVQEWSLEDIQFLQHLVPLEERQLLSSIDEEIPSRYKEVKFDGHDSTSAPFERPNPILDNSSSITTTSSFFDVSSSRRVSLDNTEPAIASKTRKGKTFQTRVNVQKENTRIPKIVPKGRKKKFGKVKED
jgi:hypothetical protein